MPRKEQGKSFKIESVDNGFIITGMNMSARHAGLCADDLAVARSASEAKAVLRELFDAFLSELDLT